MAQRRRDVEALALAPVEHPGAYEVDDFALLLLFRLRAINRSLVLLLFTGAAVTLLEEEFAPRAVGVTAAVGTAAIALPQSVRLLPNPDASVARRLSGYMGAADGERLRVACLRLPDRSPSARRRRTGAAAGLVHRLSACARRALWPRRCSSCTHRAGGALVTWTPHRGLDRPRRRQRLRRPPRWR